MREDWIEALIQTLKRGIPGLGELRVAGKDTPEGLFRSRRDHVRVLVDELAPVRIRDLHGRLARAVLVLRRYPPAAKYGVGIAAIHVDRAGEKAVAAAEAFMRCYAPEVGWALLDTQGALRLSVPKLDVDLHRAGHSVTAGSGPRQNIRLFSDLNCWMLKILLLRDTPAHLYGGPRGLVTSVEELYRVARTSRPLAYRFVRAFEESGYLRRTAEGLQVTRRGELMEAWFSEAKLRRNRVVPVRCMLGPIEQIQDLFAEGRGEPKVAMAGFYACQLLGVLHKPEERREVHVLETLDKALKQWSLEPCDERDAELFLSEPRDRQSILRGTVTIDRLPVVDILQAAIDVAGRPARGREQAEYILKGVLGWTDGI
jgi:hypothetical protein